MKSSSHKLIIAAIAALLLLQQSPARAADTAQTAAPAQPEKAPPLPLHTIDGVGGVVITPIAYLVNPGPEKQVFGLPSISGTFVGAGEKNIESFVITETLWRRLELGFSASRFGLGSLPTDVQAASVSAKTPTGIDIGRTDVWLYNFNARFLALSENSFNLPTPAITIGTQVKYNDGIEQIDHALGGALTGIGLRHDYGADVVLTATKAFPKIISRPLILSASLRLSEADQIGYVGFGNSYRPSVEGNAVYLITNHIGLAGEYRQKRNPYGSIGNLVRPETDWWTLGAAYVLNNHTTVTAGYGHFGNVLNTAENTGWALSAKYEF